MSGPLPDDQMPDAERGERESQKKRAVEATQAVFSYLEEEGREPDACLYVNSFKKIETI